MGCSIKISLSIVAVVGIFTFCGASTTSATTTTSAPGLNNSRSDLNDTDEVPKDLYVIKTVVYEVGILTDAGNDTDNTNDTQEKIDVSFYDPKFNGSAIDLSNIPVPIQTNVSGVSVTGLLPAVNLASLIAPPSAASSTINNSVPVLPKKQIKVTQNLSTSDPQRGSEIISNLPKILGLDKKTIKTSSESSEEDSSEEKKEA